jgi:hypothetical protein
MKPQTWRSVGVYTVGELQRARRRLDHKRAGLSKALTAMQRGATLQLQFDHHRGRIWTVGRIRITDEVAQLLVNRPDVASVGDCFWSGSPGSLAQTYRYIASE